MANPNQNPQRQLQQPMIPFTYSEPDPYNNYKMSVWESEVSTARPKLYPDSPNPTLFGYKSKKKVTFSPDTIIHERENKPYKYHNLFKLAQMGIFLNQDGTLQESDYLKTIDGNRRLRNMAIELTGTAADQMKLKLSKIAGFVESNLFEHDYLKFTHARKTRDYMEKTNGPAATRAERLYILMDELKIAHEFYNQLKTTATRDRFLIDELLTRHLMALDLALTEGYLGVALEVTHTLYDTTRFMLPLYAHIFYNADNSKVNLPFGEIEGTGEVETYVNLISPVVSTLNRISENRSRSDNRYFSRETLLTKLLLEILILTLCPVRSVMFRAILEIVPNTASAAYDALYASNQEPIRWANNSALRSDYEILLQNLGLADKIGCLGVNFTMISYAARNKALNKDIGIAASLFELQGNNAHEDDDN